MQKITALFRNSELSPSPIKWLIFLIVWTSLAYMLPNKIVFFEPLQVPRTFVDDLISLNPIWIWPYISFYFLIFGAFLYVQSEYFKKIIFCSYCTSTAAASLFYFFFPTAIERDPYLNANETLSISAWALNLIRTADTNVNCLPSMHISLSLLAALALTKESSKLWFISFLWFSLIAYSTMATKQHFFLDVAAGFAFGLLFWFISKKILKII
jgi:membrane-associated phospholipid phosphatase